MASSSSSSGSGSLALAAATAVAVSGSLVIFSLCRAARSAPVYEAAASGEASLRPCISSSERRRQEGAKERRRRRGERRVRFADDVIDNEGAARPTRRLPAAAEPTCRDAAAAGRMPANREALYRGMLRDRSSQRVAYSY
ncbi:hypothetical protein E2562_032016 [Oryza meyeriana var. granulata]|uniref:Uncharacterized protein n=1 Tax=Oryza meyeriana var. granulata TaxID=110450 RepID=A0A6G1FES3_9ORYZ|nr:hypothetical protein E2562_032016 [Oryza meyeriana var. granulata]